MVSPEASCLTSPTRWLACWLGFLVLSIGLQSWHGAYSSDLAGDPDEAAHAVTSLMVRDYLTQGLGQNPMRFASDYYNRFPKVALGHYPPGFYLLAGVWLLPFASIGSLLVFHAALIASLATLTMWCALRLMSCAMAVVTGLLLCVSAPIEKISLLIMSDVLVALFCLLAAVAFASFMDKPRITAALGFGLAAAFAILTKGSGWMLALLPPFAIALAGQWKLMLKPSLWIAPVPVVLLALPWQLYSYKMTEGGMSGLTLSQHFKMSVPYYLDAAMDSFGIPLLVLVAAGLAWRVYHVCQGRTGGTMAASLWALIITGLIIAVTIPAGVSSRYFIPITAPVILFAVWVAWQTAQCWLSPRLSQWTAGLLVLVSLGIGLSHKTIKKEAHGFHETMQRVARAPGLTLVCSDARGEGALVADAAFDSTLHASKDFAILRATKELSSQDWLGRGYTLAFQDDKALLDHLKKRQVRWVLIDDSVFGAYRQAHFDQLKRALNTEGSGWTLSDTITVSSGPLNTGYMRIFTSNP